MSMTSTRHATVATVVLADVGDGAEATLLALDAQVYEQVGVVVVGEADVPKMEVAGRRVVQRESLTDVLATLPKHVSHVWLVREGAIPRPDAMTALLDDMERTGASVAGSKIVRGDDERLVSVGLVTDAFAVPYTGMDSVERDQGQYDVVRDVAAVAGVSMMIRRDLLAGLGGLDADMSQRAATVDLCHRARLKGARIIISPASLIEFPDVVEAPNRWREEASRIRSVIKAYGPLTLAWVLPLDFLIGLTEAVVSIFLGRWLVFDFLRAWIWNIYKLPSTLSGRREARRGRVAGDSELFRYQRRGSVKISRLGVAVATGLRKRLPGDDKLSVESIGSDVRQPAFIVGALAVIFVLLSARNIWADGLPSIGFTMPFPSDGWDALSAYAGGWNPAELGSPDPLRPLIGIASIAKILTFNAPILAEYLIVAGALLFGIWGVTRLLRTWSIPAAPALIAGVVYVAGPAAQGIAGNTHLGTLVGLGVLPWALRVCLAPFGEGLWHGLTRFTAIVLTFGVLGAFSPLLLLVPAPVLGLYALLRFTEERGWQAVMFAVIGTAGGALLLSPWIWTAGMLGIARQGYAFWNVSLFLIGVAAVVVGAAVIGGRREVGVVAGWAAVLAGAGFVGARSGEFGFGTEFESASLAVLSLGVAVAVGIVSESVITPSISTWRRMILGVGAVGSVLLVVASLTIVLGGRGGLPQDLYQETLGFAEAREGEAETSRILVVGPEDLMPGDARTIRNGAYRTVSGTGPDLGEVRVAERLAFDELLRSKLEAIIDGETRSAGGELATFGIRWIVVMGDSSGPEGDEASLAWRNVFAGQLDLLSISSGTGNATFVNDTPQIGRALTASFDQWERDGWTYRGDASNTMNVFVAENGDNGFGPQPSDIVRSMNVVSASAGVVTYEPDQSRRAQAWVVAASIAALIAVGFVARRRR